MQCISRHLLPTVVESALCCPRLEPLFSLGLQTACTQYTSSILPGVVVPGTGSQPSNTVSPIHIGAEKKHSRHKWYHPLYMHSNGGLGCRACYSFRRYFGIWNKRSVGGLILFCKYLADIWERGLAKSLVGIHNKKIFAVHEISCSIWQTIVEN